MRAHLERLLRTAVAAAVALFTLSPAQAAVYAGAWDPPFGTAQFKNLWWSGTFSVETDCPSGSGESKPDALPCGPVDVLSATVTLTGKLLGTTIDTPITLEFNTAGTDGLIDSVSKLKFAPNKIEQLQTGLSEWLTPSGTVYQFALQFVINGEVAISDPLLPNDPLPASYSGPILFIKGPANPPDNPNVTSNANGNGNGGQPPTLQVWRASVEVCPDPEKRETCYTPVFSGLLLDGAVAIPEPGVLTLIGGALLAAGWSRRSRREQRAVAQGGDGH